MRKNRIVFIAVLAAVLIISLFTGCDTSAGTSGEVDALLDAAKEQLANLQGDMEDWKTKAEEYQKQIKELSAESGLTGATDKETAENIVKNYYETHTYSKADLFVCADMAMDVWNMLQAQGISAVIQIGDVEKAVMNMQDSGHAWVIAEVAPGEKLALETTNGRSVSRTENPLYYTGWSFENPQNYKRFEQLKHEHNIRVAIFSSMIKDKEVVSSEYQAAVDAYNDLVDKYNAGQTTAEKVNEQLAVMKELEGRYNQLQNLLIEQEAAINKIPPEMALLTK